MDIEKEIEKYEKAIKTAETNLSRAPSGHLRISGFHGKEIYYSDENYLSTKDKSSLALIKKLAQKEYCEKVVKKLQTEIKVLKKAQDIIKCETLRKIYEDEHPGRKKFIEPFEVSTEEFVRRWINEPYPKKILNSDLQFYETNAHDKVRSKSEKIIADQMFSMGIPYRYEMKHVIVVEEHGDKRTILFYPDFTVLNKRTGQVFIFEHFGLLDDVKYLTNSVEKIELYAKNGFILGKNFVFSFELNGHGLNIAYLNTIFKSYFI